MSGPEISWYGKSILGCGLWPGLVSGKKGSGPIMSNFWGPFFHFFGVKKRGPYWEMKSQILRGDLPIFELDSWNFQQVLDLGFPETSQSLSSFKQLLFSSFHRGDQRKKIKNCESPPKSGSSFPNRDPLSKKMWHKQSKLNNQSINIWA